MSPTWPSGDPEGVAVETEMCNKISDVRIRRCDWMAGGYGWKTEQAFLGWKLEVLKHSCAKYLMRWICEARTLKRIGI